MNQDKRNYIEETGLLFEELGMTRMAGRIFGYLLVCDENAVSSRQIMNATEASKGSVSTTTRQLLQTGLVETVSLPGDRKTYFRVTKLELGSLLRSRVRLFSKFAGVLDKGRSLRKREDDISGWLQEAAAFYNWIGPQIDESIQSWHRKKNETLNPEQESS